jgi:tripartite motif-containing protein 2/3
VQLSDEVLRHGNETEVLVVKKMLSDRLEELHSTKIRQDPEENDVVYFNAQEETMLKAIQTLGSVKVSSAYAALSCVVGGLKRVPHGKKSSFTVNTR